MASSGTVRDHVSIHVPPLPPSLTEPRHEISPRNQPTLPEGHQTGDTTHRPGDTAAQQPHGVDNRDTDAHRGENYGDSSGRLWTMYLTEAEEHDKVITESWKGEAEGILVFTGLFSATVAAFIIESYKQLSPDSGDTTNVLLTQISQQLANISNGALTNVAVQSSQPFKPTASAVRINVLWFLSLVFSLTCALWATLMQQWARRYQELAHRRGAPHKRARLRAYIFDGITRFNMTQAILAMPILLHLSVFLFFAGLIEFLFPINTTVAYVILVSIALFAAAYAILTILPNLYHNCPYRTPLSGITWLLYQFSVLEILWTIRGVVGLFHKPLVTLWGWWTHYQMARTSGPIKWKDALDEKITIRQKWLMDGPRKRVELSATDAPPSVDKDALEWTLTVLDEDTEIEDFVARVPGFFDSKAVPDPTSAILPLMSDQDMTDPILGSRLYDLIKTCIPGTSSLAEDKRRSRLRVCLETLWYCVRAYTHPQNSDPLPSYVCFAFADPEMTHQIQMERDLAARVIGCCFGALVATKLSVDIGPHRVDARDERLVCLSAILRAESHEVNSWLVEHDAIELAIINSLMTVAEYVMPPNVLDVFKKTLRILSHPLLSRSDLRPPMNQVTQFHMIYSGAPDWLRDELQQVSNILPQDKPQQVLNRPPPGPSHAQGGIVFPEPHAAQGVMK